jgi:hypothetical protein
MIPPFDDYGNLPPGIHRATIEEVRARFGDGSPEREAEMDELAAFVTWAKEFGIERIVVNGSFVTGKLAPQDVDVIILPGSQATLSALPNDLDFPFLQIILAADNVDLEAWAINDFGTDRKGRSKGVIELIL